MTTVPRKTSIKVASPCQSCPLVMPLGIKDKEEDNDFISGNNRALMDSSCFKHEKLEGSYRIAQAVCEPS